MKMEISSNFVSGNIEVAGIDAKKNEIRQRIRKDTNSEFLQWFHFRLTGSAFLLRMSMVYSNSLLHLHTMLCTSHISHLTLTKDISIIHLAQLAQDVTVEVVGAPSPITHWSKWRTESCTMNSLQKTTISYG